MRGTTAVPRRGLAPIGLSVVILFVLALTAWHLFVAAKAGLNPDEAYYWLWSRYPAWAYYDHPPMVAWWIALGTSAFGATGLGIRLLTIVSTVALSAVVYATGRVLFDRPVAARGALWLAATLLVAVAGLFATPDAPATLFWALAILAFALVVKTGRGAWWLAVGLFAGLGIQSKYNDLFLGLGLILALALDRDLRRWLVSPWTWAGGAVALLVFAPVILWNYRHDWASFAKQFGRIAESGFDPSNLAGLAAGQFVFLNPFVALFVGLAVLIALRRRSTPTTRAIGILLATTAPLLIYMLIHAIHSRVDANWLAPVYPGLALVAAAAAEAEPGDRVRGFMRAAVVPFAAALSLAGLFYLVVPPPKSPLADDPAQAFRGWPEFAGAADRLRQAQGAGWIATNDYNLAAELTFHLLGKGVPVEQVGERIRYVFAPPPDAALLGEKALLLLRGRPEDATDYVACFGKSSPLGLIGRTGIGGADLGSYRAFLVEAPDPRIFAAGCDRPR